MQLQDRDTKQRSEVRNQRSDVRGQKSEAKENLSFKSELRLQTSELSSDLRPPTSELRIAVLSAMAIAIHSIESLVPMPVPWLRIGFSNVISLIAFISFGFKTAMAITITRVFVSAMLIGTFPGPAFVLSLSGGILSTSALAMASIVPFFGITGLSIVSAFFHVIGQLSVAYYLFIKQPEAVIAIAPLLALMATFTGAINGGIAGLILTKLKRMGVGSRV
jgi:heptaprenyl diphosphate synthase